MEKENLNYDTNSRFISRLDDYVLKNSNGEVISEPEKYLKQRENEMPICNEKCLIGDVVILKMTNQQIKITDVDIKVNDNFKFDYSGKDILGLEEKIYFFNQNDIANVIQQKHR